MKTRVGLVALLIATSVAAVADAPRITRSALARLESSVDALLTGGQFPSELFGNTTGVYMDGFGAVFVTRIALIPTPLENPFHTMTAKEITAIHDRKMAQIPRLKEKMREMLFTMAASPSLEGVRAHEQVVCGVTMFYYRWEQVDGLPFQVVMQAEKQKLLDIRAGRLPREQLDTIVKVQEL